MIMKRGILDDVDDLGVYVDDGMKKHLKTCPAPRCNQPRGKGATSMQIRRLWNYVDDVEEMQKSTLQKST